MRLRMDGRETDLVLTGQLGTPDLPRPGLSLLELTLKATEDGDGPARIAGDVLAPGRR